MHVFRYYITPLPNNPIPLPSAKLFLWRHEASLLVRGDFGTDPCRSIHIDPVHGNVSKAHKPILNQIKNQEQQDTSGRITSQKREKEGGTYRSIHAPGGNLAATRFATNPPSSKVFTYHGLSPALLTMTRPPTLSALFTARICVRAASPPGSNQSILSISTAIVSVSGAMRSNTSTNSSVWMRRPSNAPGEERRMCAFGVRYDGWHRWV